MKLRVAFALIAWVFCAMCVVAQSSATGNNTGRFAGHWAASTPGNDVTATAFVTEVINNGVTGSPAGLHLILGTAQGQLDVAAGPYAPKAIREISVGNKLQVTGKMETVNGKNYLFAKQLVLNNETFTIRNDRGVVLRHRTKIRTQAQSVQNGAL
ncbi:hypothetical protein [Terriglobus roseus]|uniref:DUF5666 domain-containing protein n=1 Tax=Terriglobus roseus TaxID=392734 RepID=A0A1G7KLN5_9BACT|nr:hypothetical protein [Terriglobus roseus]SDF38066.1 hypothetical protein SAMN05444167_2232 [Terriglobus roseus]